MADPTGVTPFAVTAAGLTVFGMVTGLHPPLLIVGLAGGLWAQFYVEAMPVGRRIASAIMASLAAAWMSPALAYGLPSFNWWPKTIPSEILQFPVALLTGLLSNAIGLMAIKVFTAKAEGFAK